jgi:ceramide glucosyltransferase
LKPIRGLEKNLRINLRSTCLQDYPDFQVVFSVGDRDDPGVPLSKEIQEEYPEKVFVAVGDIEAWPNGKINPWRYSSCNLLLSTKKY